jgi:ribosomal protein S18 acetylase RimI-like enzyme
MPNDIKYRKITSQWVKKLARFFQEIVINKEDNNFHPHPLDIKEAEYIASYPGQDLYFLQIKGNEITGYGMLRGWDEGFSVPSLGIAIHPSSRRQGLAKNFMAFMHQRAKEKGAKKIRLTVYTDNIAAIRLYRSIGYTFSEEKDHKVVGFCELYKK